MTMPSSSEIPTYDSYIDKQLQHISAFITSIDNFFVSNDEHARNKSINDSTLYNLTQCCEQYMHHGDNDTLLYHYGDVHFNEETAMAVRAPFIDKFGDVWVYDSLVDLYMRLVPSTESMLHSRQHVVSLLLYYGPLRCATRKEVEARYLECFL